MSAVQSSGGGGDIRSVGEGPASGGSDKRTGSQSAGALSRQSLEDSTFAVLFVMHSRGGDKKTKGFRYLDILLIVVDYLQMIAFVADTKRFNWVQFDWLNSTFQFVFAAVPRSFLATSGYAVYVALFAAVVVVTVLSILDALWVLQSFRTNQFNQLWPIKLLKFAVSLFFSSFFLSALGILFIALDCNYTDSGARFQLTNYPEVVCWGFPNVILVILTILTTLVILLFASALSLVDADTDPSATAATAAATPYESLYGTVARALLVAVSVAASYLASLLAAAAFFSGAFLAGSVIFYLPYYNARVNQLRAALYGTVAWCSAIAFGLAVAPQHPRSLSLAFVIGFPLSALLCAYAAHVRQKRLCDPNRLIVYNAETGWTFRGRFRWPHEVEIATRFLQAYTAKLEKEEAEGRSTEVAAAALEEALEKADAVYRAGLRRFPDSALVYLQYAGFVQAYYKDAVMEASFVDRARVLELDLMSRFFVFRKLKDREREATGAGGAAMDIVSFVEFQEKFRLAREGYRKALKATRVFWTSLLERDESEAISKASEVCRSIDTYEQQASRNYAVLVEKYPRSIRLLRSYGAFVENVKNDPAAAEAYYRRADAEEEEQSRKRTRDDADGGGADGSMDNSMDGVVVMSALGMITSANAVACRMFGYKKAELIGKRIEVLMPSPFRDSHASYVQTYMQTGVTRMINAARELPALHKNGGIFPVRLLVSRVDIASKASFVGSLRPLDNSAPLMLVLPAGRVLACNRACDMLFGRSAEDLVSCSLKELVAQRHAQKALDMISGDYISAGQIRRASAMRTQSVNMAPQSARRRSAGEIVLAPGVNRRPTVASESGDGNPQRAVAGGSAVVQYSRASTTMNKDEIISELDGLDREGCIFPAGVRVLRATAGAGGEVVASLVYLRPRTEARGIIIADAKGAIRGVNHAACEMWGYEAKDMVGSRIEDLMPPAYAQTHRHFVERYIAAQKTRSLGSKRLVECRHRIGHCFGANISLERADAAGEIFFCARIIRLESDLDEKTVLIAIDQRGIINCVRGRVHEKLGYHAIELMGRSVNTLMPPEIAEHHDEYLRRFLADPSKTLIVGTGARQVKCIHRDGLQVEGMLALSVSPHNGALAEHGLSLLVGRLSFPSREREASAAGADREHVLKAAASAFWAAGREHERHAHGPAAARPDGGGSESNEGSSARAHLAPDEEEGDRRAPAATKERRAPRPAHGDANSVTSGGSVQRRLKKRRRALVALSKRPSGTVRRLWRNLVISAFLLFAVTVASFVAAQTMVNAYVGLLKALSASSARTILSVLMTVESRTLAGSMEGLAADDSPLFGSAAESGARLRSYATQFLSLLKSMTFGLNGYSAPTDPSHVELVFGRTKLQMQALKNGAVEKYGDGFWRAGLDYAQHSLVLASLPNGTSAAGGSIPSFATQHDTFVELSESGGLDGISPSGVASLRTACAARLGECPSLFFVLRNGPLASAPLAPARPRAARRGAVYEAARETSGFRRHAMDAAQTNLLIARRIPPPLVPAVRRRPQVYSVSIAVGVVVLLLAGALAFRPAFRQVRRERDQVLDLFLEIPKPVVRLLARKQAALAVGSSSSGSGSESEGEGGGEGGHEGVLPTARPAAARGAGARRATRPSVEGPPRGSPRLSGSPHSDPDGHGRAHGEPAPAQGPHRRHPRPRGDESGSEVEAARAAQATPVSAAPPPARAKQYAPASPPSAPVEKRAGSLSSLFRAAGPGPPRQRSVRRSSSLHLRRPLALSAAHGKGSEKLFRRLTLQYAAASCLVAACFAAVFVAGYSVALRLEEHTTSVAAATERRVAAARATMLAREAVVPAMAAAAGAPPDSSLYMDVPGALHALAADVEEVAAADERLQLASTATPDLADLTFGTSCLRYARDSCAARPGPALDFAATGGVSALVAMFVEQGRLLAGAPAALRSHLGPAYTFLWRSGLADLLGALSAAENLYVQDGRELVTRLVPTHGALMAVTVFLLLAIVLLQYRPMVRRLRDETRRTHHMLQLIPDDVLDRVESIREYVDKHMADLGD